MRASERAYLTLREEILDGVLAPGAELDEREQAERLGVSRTPTREAFARLASDGLTEPAGRGVVVAALTATGIRDLYELREALEAKAAALAAARRDPAEFEVLAERFREAPARLAAGDAAIADYYALAGRLDEAVDRAVGNAYFVQALRQVRLHSARARRLAREHPDRLAESATEHRLIAEAIANGDAVLAEHAAHVHLRQSLRHVLATIA
ncbi:GntR family transcriptional regulator [Agromyces seonyuensis]|uniref:FCD domain-containing protein n=1 Tax=Agromyces seonyuensis TaxID=2662446 RepID=A0A6I4NZC9_9MICO|nr:GntR family transcriptional regulator [Agromyces seonyuensis]MWB98582.1 FCD domain-containing protein [Agromyces seonyuensis]